MSSKNHRVPAMITVIILVLSAWASAAPKGKLLHTFGGTQGAYPGGLVSDSTGNLFGLTLFGGLSCPGGDGCGTAFELSPGADGSWQYKLLHKFAGGLEGYAPSGNLIFDALGNLYGVNGAGGRYKGGTAFELSPNSDGTWSETTLYSFGAYAGDAASPQYGLVFDDAGNLYGTTPSGGPDNLGTVFELSPHGDGNWSEAVLYSFGDVQVESDPHCSLVLDSVGNLYGTTLSTVFEVSRVAGGWIEQVLFSFNNKGVGEAPFAGVIFDSNGNLYGTTSAGGIENAGTVFELSLVSGSWIETILHGFRPSRGDGGFPMAPVTFGPSGDIYGTTSGSSSSQFGYGTVFQLTLSGSGWTETKRYNFTGGRDGSTPVAGVIFDSSGNLYGTTQSGGSSFGLFGYGVVFQTTP